MYRLVAAFLYYLGVERLFRSLGRRRLRVLVLTDLFRGGSGERNSTAETADERSCERLVLFLKRRYQILPLEEAVQRLWKGTLPPYTVALAVDGWVPDLRNDLLAVLHRHQVPATAFVTPGLAMPASSQEMGVAHATAHASGLMAFGVSLTSWPPEIGSAFRDYVRRIRQEIQSRL
jgi:hypothetical protein